MGYPGPPSQHGVVLSSQPSKNTLAITTPSGRVDERGLAFIESMVSREVDKKHVVRLTIHFLDGMVEVFETESEDYLYARKDVMKKANAIAQIIPRPPLPIVPDSHFGRPVPTPPHPLHTSFPLPAPPPVLSSYRGMNNDGLPILEQQASLGGFPPLARSKLPSMQPPSPYLHPLSRSYRPSQSHPPPQSHLSPPSHLPLPSHSPRNPHLFGKTSERSAPQVQPNNRVRLRSAPAPIRNIPSDKLSHHNRSGFNQCHPNENHVRVNNQPSNPRIASPHKSVSSGSSDSFSPGRASSPESLDLEPPPFTDPLAIAPGRPIESNPTPDPGKNPLLFGVPNSRSEQSSRTDGLLPSNLDTQRNDNHPPHHSSSSPGDRFPPQNKRSPQNNRAPQHHRSPAHHPLLQRHNFSTPNRQPQSPSQLAAGSNAERLGCRKQQSERSNGNKRRKTIGKFEKSSLDGGAALQNTGHTKMDNQPSPESPKPPTEISKAASKPKQTNDKEDEAVQKELLNIDAEKNDSVQEDDGTNYVSMLNVLFTRHRNIFSFLETDWEQVVNSSEWMAKLSILRKTEDDKLESIREFGTHLNKKIAKQMAARKLIHRINQLYPYLALGSTAATAPQKNMSATDTGSFTAVSVLFNLFQKGILQAKPNFTVQEVDGDEGKNMWRVTCVVQPVGFNDISCSAVEKKKTTGKHAAAKQVISELKKKKVPMIEPIIEGKAKFVTRYNPKKGDAVLPENTEEMVRLSDDEDDSEFKTTETYDDRVMLPSDYTVSIPKSEKEIESWLGENVGSTTNIGVYLDSRFMRDELKLVAKNHKFVIPEPLKKEDVRVICFATESSALLLCASRFKNLPNRKCWIPNAAVRLLTTRTTTKHGFMTDGAALTLGARYGIEVVSINNIQVNSFSLIGEAGSGNCALMPIHRLVTRWLNKRFQPFSGAVISSVPGLKELMDNTEDFVCPAVLVAYVCVEIGFKLKKEGAAKRFDARTAMPGFEDLAKRLIPLLDSNQIIAT